jgi:hypothetical protein
MESVVASFKIEKEYLNKIDIIAKQRSNTRSQYIAYLIRREVDSVLKYGIDYIILDEAKKKFPKDKFPDGVPIEKIEALFKDVTANTPVDEILSLGLGEKYIIKGKK